MAFVILSVFVTIPTLVLFLYPFKFFQECLSILPFRWHFLHAFVDSFQGCYKDGTEPGTFDCRWFLAIFLLCRTLLFIAFGLTLSIMYYIYGTIILVVLLIAMINIQPFKKIVIKNPTNDLTFLILFSIVYVVIAGRSLASMHNTYYMTLMPLLLATAFVPLLYITFLIGSWLISRARFMSVLCRRLQN